MAVHASNLEIQFEVVITDRWLMEYRDIHTYFVATVTLVCCIGGVCSVVITS
eukprot:m.1011565 g.1011565  ORF g.1011565 m.1011565 type:complete len:52 (-) comp24062_c0_seq19:4672-4827(-)